MAADGSPQAFVTGGARGIGLAVSRALLRDGLAVTAAARSADDLERARRELAGEAFTAVALDVRDDAAVDAAVTAVAARGPLRVVVAAHGIYPDPEPVPSTPTAAFRGVLETNLVGAFSVASAAARAMRGTGGGAIVLVGSANGLAGEGGQAAYNASKAGVHSLAQTLAVDLAADGIRAVAVAPGWVRTAMTEAHITPEVEAGTVRWNAQRRVAEPEEVAAVVAFLASPAARYVTGCTVPVDGGQMSEAPGPWLD
jgi:3-oxoacyl-[acyl-carrier protein] reductase